MEEKVKVKVEKHCEMIVVVSALVDKKDDTQIRIKTGVFADEPYTVLADSVADTLIKTGEEIRKDVKEKKDEK